MTVETVAAIVSGSGKSTSRVIIIRNETFASWQSLKFIIILGLTFSVIMKGGPFWSVVPTGQSVEQPDSPLCNRHPVIQRVKLGIRTEQ